MEPLFYRHNRNPGLIVMFVDDDPRLQAGFRIPGRRFFRNIGMDTAFMCDDTEQFHKDYTEITDEDEIGILLLQVTP